MSAPQVVILSGPNGAGKSTLAAEIVFNQLGIADYVNADTIARGLSEFNPEEQAFHAGRYMLEHLKRLAAKRVDFAFETTLATRSFAVWIDELKASGYEFGLIYVWLPDPELSIRRVAARVRQGGHHVPENDIRRRYERGKANFSSLYQSRAVWWEVYNGSGETGPKLVADGSGSNTWSVREPTVWKSIVSLIMDARAKPSVAEAIQDYAGIERACIASARNAARLHRFHGMPLIVSRDGQIVEISPADFEKGLDEREAKLNAAEAAEGSAASDS